MRRVLAALIFATLPAPLSAADGGALACFAAGQKPAAVIGACTAALGSGLNAETRVLALLARADAYVAATDLAAARRDFDAVLRLAPNHTAALMGRARINEAEGKAQAAETDLSAVIAAEPAPEVQADAYTRRGALRLARGAADDAATDLEQAGRLLPRDVEIRRALAKARIKGGQIKSAILVLNGALGLAPADIDLLRMRGLAYAQARQFGPAINDFSAVLAAQPEDQPSLEGRGVAALQNGIYGRALADFTRLADLRPNDPHVVFLRANAQLQSGHLKESVDDYTLALKALPGDEESLFGRATARMFQADYAAAEADLGAILAKAPAAAQAIARRGHVRFLRQAYKDAAADFAQALTLPDAPADLLLWQFVAASRGGDTGAAKTLAAGIQKTPADSWPATVARYFLGQISGDDLIKAARNSQGRLCEAYFHLGQAALIQHDSAEAAKLFTAARSTGMSRYVEYAAALAELARQEGVQEKWPSVFRPDNRPKP